jgi:hypothetical protein
MSLVGNIFINLTSKNGKTLQHEMAFVPLSGNVVVGKLTSSKWNGNGST